MIVEAEKGIPGNSKDQGLKSSLLLNSAKEYSEAQSNVLYICNFPRNTKRQDL